MSVGGGGKKDYKKYIYQYRQMDRHTQRERETDHFTLSYVNKVALSFTAHSLFEQVSVVNVFPQNFSCCRKKNINQNYDTIYKKEKPNTQILVFFV